MARFPDFGSTQRGFFEMDGFSRVVAGMWRLAEWKLDAKALLDFLAACIDCGVTSFDHADIYGDIDEIKNSFARLVDIMPAEGCLVACLDDPLVREVVKKAKCRVIGYGLQPELDFYLKNIQVKPDGTSFDVMHQGEPYGTFNSPMPGRHNGFGCRRGHRLWSGVAEPRRSRG